MMDSKYKMKFIYFTISTVYGNERDFFKLYKINKIN